MSALNNTKKPSAETELRKATKLPKLTIQQQLDNQEVIERMNRKITYMKNQRHLGKTMQYSQAFESKPTAQVFRVSPSELLFTDYEINRVYESQVKLVNGSNSLQRIKITPLQKKQFVVAKVKYPYENSGDIAPGMAVSVFIRFRPMNLHDNEDELILIVGDGVVKVPIRAKRQKCKGEWPRKVQCGHCWVGDQTHKTINVINKGGEAVYRLKGISSDKQWYQSNCFTVSPTILTVRKNKQNSIAIKFQPNREGLFHEQLCYISDQGDSEEIFIDIEGGAYTAHLTLDEINGQRVSKQKFQNCLYLTDCEPRKTSSSTFKIHNHAVVKVEYFWHFGNQPGLTISNREGRIGASETFEFSVRYTPENNTPKFIMAYLYLYNLPKESIMSQFGTKNINGIEAIECIQLQIKVSSRQSRMEVFPLHKRLTQPLYRLKHNTTSFKVANNSNTNRKFEVQFIKQTEHCECRFLGEGNRDLAADSQQEIEFDFCIKQFSQEPQFAYFLVVFENSPAKMISLEGRVEFPDLRLLTACIDFGLTRTHSRFHKKFRVVNQGENEVSFKVNNPFRFFTLDFYDRYEFEDESFFADRLRIVDESNLECRSWLSVPPASERTIQFQLFTVQADSIDLSIELEIKDGPTYPLTVTAEVQDISGTISRSNVNMKQIYKGNLYNSNKFLSRELSLNNTGNMGFTFEVIPEAVEQCNFRFDPLHGSITADAKQRLDVIVEPIKTGHFTVEYRINYYDDQPQYPSEYGINQSLQEVIEIVPENRKSLLKTESLSFKGEVRGVEINYYLKDESRARKVRRKLEQNHGSVKSSSAISFKSNSKSHYLEADKTVYPVLEELNFYHCEINKVHQVEIIIENDSGLTAEYQIYAQSFRSEAGKIAQPSNSSQGFMRSDELAFTSQMGKHYLQGQVLNNAQKVHLSNNKGISILCDPWEGQLHKKQQQKIVITMFNDTSGKFRDELVISIKDHEVKRFPINMLIKGTPVSLSRNQLGIDFNQETPMLHCGEFLPHNGKVTRNIKIINNGPKEVFLRWLFYVRSKSQPDQDLFSISLLADSQPKEDCVQVKWDPIKPQIEADPQFAIAPMEKTIKGREEASFILTIKEFDRLQTSQTLLIGEPYLVEDQSRREMECLAVVLKALAVHPELRIDRKHSNHIQKFKRFAEVGQQARTKAKDYHRKLRLKNINRCNITFMVEIETTKGAAGSFEIVSTDTDSALNKKKLAPPATFGKTKLNQLQNTVVEIQRQFTLPYDSYVEIGIELNGNPNDTDNWPVEQKVRRDGVLRLIYSNGDSQEIPLVGWLLRPHLQIEMPDRMGHSAENNVIDFGVVHVKNSKMMSIYLANPSPSAANWSISYIKYQTSKKIVFEKQLWTDLDREDEIISDDKKCFRLSRDCGHLLAESIPVHYIPGALALYHEDDGHAAQHKPVEVDFLFKPQKNILYKSKFIINVEHGPSYEIIVRGRGTYEEEKQIK